MARAITQPSLTFRADTVLSDQETDEVNYSTAPKCYQIISEYSVSHGGWAIMRILVTGEDRTAIKLVEWKRILLLTLIIMIIVLIFEEL